MGCDTFLPAFNWFDMIIYNRALAVQAAVIFIAIGIFMLRKKSYR